MCVRICWKVVWFMAELHGVDRFRKSKFCSTVLFNIMNKEFDQVNYLLKSTVLSDFIMNSTIIAHMCFNPSAAIFWFQEKMFQIFAFKSHILDKVLHFKCLLLPQIRFSLWIINLQRRFNSNVNSINLKFLCWRSVTDQVISHWILKFYELFLN